MFQDFSVWQLREMLVQVRAELSVAVDELKRRELCVELDEIEEELEGRALEFRVRA